MAKEEQEKKPISRVKIKRKLWYKILAPQLFGEKEVGEAYLTNPEVALGRKVKVNLKDLTGNVKDQNAYVEFLINAVSGSSLRTTAVGYELTPSFVKRLVRKGSDRLDDCFVVKLKEGQKVVIKILTITQYKAQRSAQSKLRKQTLQFFKEEAGKSDFDTFLINLIAVRLQAAVKKKCSKIMPLRDLMVRVVELHAAPERDREQPAESLAESSLPAVPMEVAP